MTDLLPCPFCGGEAILIEGDESAYVQCLDVSCHVGPFFDGDNDASNSAVAEWNRRSDTAARKAAFEEAAKVADRAAEAAADMAITGLSEHARRRESMNAAACSIAAAIRALAEKG